MALNKKYGKVEYNQESKKWLLYDLEPHVCIKIKAIFPKLSKWGSQPFEFNDLPEIGSDLLWFMERYPLSISEKDLSKLKRTKKAFTDNINDLEKILMPDYIPVDVVLKEGYKAREYQIKGKDIYIKSKRLLLGDEIGLGKTLTAILSFQKETLPAVVVVQTHLPKQWADEITKFTNLTTHIITKSTPYSLPKADVYIIKYSCLGGWVNIFEKGIFKSAIFDEIQELRRKESIKYSAGKILSQNVKHCMGMSATPIYNYGNEIFNIMNLLNDGCLGGWDEFYREWCTGHENRIVVKDPKALGTYLREKFLFLRRTREDVGRELPPINTIVHTVGYDQKEIEKSQQLAKTLALKVLHGSFVERGSAARELDMFIRHQTGISKARDVAEYVKILLENNEPVLLAGWHRDVYSIWMEELAEYKPVMYTGTESATQKENTKQAFISGETNLMIISLRSGIGLDGLQHRCKTVVIGELDWSPKVHEQLIGRVDRDGQKDQVTAIYLVSEEGSDPFIIDILGVKASQSHNIIDPLKGISVQFTDESRMKAFAENYLKKLDGK